MTPIQKLIDDLYWEYDRMSSSGQATLDKLNKLFFTYSKLYLSLSIYYNIFIKIVYNVLLISDN